MGMNNKKPLLKRLIGVVSVTAGAFYMVGCGGGGNGADDFLTVSTQSGLVKGFYKDGTAGSAREFLGIPYAKPPLGELRFAPPQPVEPWSEPYQAMEFGASCMQNVGALSASGDVSEDCLTLNVYSPDGVNTSTLPVMVFIHGGAFISGGSNQYDGWRLAEQYGAVVVTLNYRLGALGFLSLPELDATLPAADAGNAALEDQRLALEWVQQNIGSFGGDKDNVTLFGESAGSMSACVHMVSPGSQNLADKFIMESAVCVGGLPVNTKQQATAVGTDLANAFCEGEADQLACLRAVPAADLVAWGADAGIFGAGWSPTVISGSNMLPDAPINLIESGQYNQGPIIVGTNVREWGLFQLIGSGETVATVDEFNAVIDATYPAQLAPSVKQVYAPAADAVANLKLIEVLTDQLFRCPARTLARATTAMGSEVWLYSFEQGAAYHAMELPYVFGNPSATLAPELNEPTREAIQSYWSAFAAGGNPNLDSQPEWPGFDAGSDQHMVLKEASEAASELATATCDFWDDVAASQAAGQ
ncbi:carboxylesterase family protein [Ketobacter sp. MCCC 1A13808]|nr:carboxylesterase family protein [Ketobacter sp. MCCC 1A13808]